jgi:tetratricopeptide (TPR) repeat protein
LVETSSLSQKIYHLALKKKYGSNWPDLPPSLQMTEQVDDYTLIALIQQLAKTRDVYYLHPSFGYYFETFYLKPRNMVFQLLPLPKGQVQPPVLTASEIQENLAFWKEHADGDLKPLRRSGSEYRKKLTSESSSTEMLGAFYARSLNLVGTEMQRAGDIVKAGEMFALAKEFNPQNAVSLINYDFNRSLVAGKPNPGKYSEEATALLTAYEGNINNLLGICGPADEPHLCALLSGIFENGQNFKQAAQQMLRFNALQPDNVPAQITLARLYIRGLETELGLQQIARLRLKPEMLSDENKAELVQYEAWAFASRQEVEKAENLLKTAITQFPKNSAFLNNALVELYIGSGRLTNAFAALQSQINDQPENLNPMINYTALKIQNREFTDAIAMTDRILKIQPTNSFALMNRAIACLQADRLDESEQAYHELLNILQKPPYSIYYGLGEIAYKKKNKEEALKNFDRYLQLIPAKSPEARLVKDRIKNLKSGTF